MTRGTRWYGKSRGGRRGETKRMTIREEKHRKGKKGRAREQRRMEDRNVTETAQKIGQ
jgi:hypothetical protein